MKVVINSCFGGYGLSKKAVQWLADHGCLEANDDLNVTYEKNHFLENFFSSYVYENDRSNPLLVECVETLGVEANGDCSKLKIIEIPDDIRYEIDEYDGMESIHEIHRSWS